MKSKYIDKICCILNYAPHYREEVFLSMEKEMNCDFYVGDKTYGEIKKIDYSKFRTTITELKFKKVFRYYYFLKGQIRLSFRAYDHYIITGQPYNISSWILLLLNKIRGKKTFIWNHGWYGNETGIKKLIKKIQFTCISGYLLYGNYAKELMIKEGFNPKKLYVIFNSLHYQKHLKIRSELKRTTVYKDYFKNEHPVLVFIGRLTSIKKLDMIIEAMKISAKEGVFFNLVLIGSGNEKERLQKKVKGLNLNETVWFYGACYEEDTIGELIYNADICVSPGNIGLTAIHSLTYGTPAITHNNFSNQMPEFEAVKEGITGSFFVENKIDSLKETIQNWLLKNPHKDDIIIQNCFSVIDKCYNPDYQIKVLKRILK